VSRLIDLSHTVEHGMVTYKGLPAPLICDFLSREASRAVYAAGTEFHIGRIDMVANTASGRLSTALTFVARRCSSSAAGIATGGRTPISKATRF
jgi:hypothetical protein